jgi:N-acetyl-gamma-glutamyl-phosphate reductase
MYIIRVFIDGSAGTTGLQLEARLRKRDDVSLKTLPEALERDIAARETMLNEADVAMLCLPDRAARQAVKLIHNQNTVVIDASTAHRTAPGWTYGFPELGPSFREGVEHSKRIAVPGCHATGFIALVYPLVFAGLLPGSALLHCISITGYSGGGKPKIAEYEAQTRTPGDSLHIPSQYAWEQSHKHLPEMSTIAGLATPPVFCPIVGDFFRGMEVTIPLHRAQLHNASCANVLDSYREIYQRTALIQVYPDVAALPSIAAMAHRDALALTVAGNEERMLLVARLDNLGKGAAGAAVQCLNLAICAQETSALYL